LTNNERNLKMSDETHADAQAANGAQSQVDTTEANPGPTDGVQATPDTTNDELSKTRKEAAKYRTELRAATAKLEAFEAAKLSDAERLEKRATDAETRAANLESGLRSLQARLSATEAAREANARRPEAVAKLINIGALEFSDDGEVVKKSLAAEITRIKAEFGELFQAGAGSANGAAGAQPVAGDMNAILRAYASR